MPPKKKGKKNKKKNVKINENDDGNKLKRSQKEIILVKDRLALQTEIGRRASSLASTVKSDLEEAEKRMKEQKEHEKAISGELSRQYKTMQVEMSIQIRQLEAEVSHLRQQLSHTNNELDTYKKLFTKMEDEKNGRIFELQTRIDGMEGSYERVLTESLDSLMLKIEDSSKHWDQTSLLLQEKSKKMLLNFGLNHLDI